jgi:hypothetical protein
MIDIYLLYYQDRNILDRRSSIGFKLNIAMGFDLVDMKYSYLCFANKFDMD